MTDTLLSSSSGSLGGMSKVSVHATACWVFPAWKSWLLVTSARSPPATGFSGCFPKAAGEKLYTQVWTEVLSAASPEVVQSCLAWRKHLHLRVVVDFQVTVSSQHQQQQP